MKDYKTIRKQTRTEIIVKKSKFISTAKPINCEQEAVDFINEIKSEFWDATHNVYAYIVEENGIQRYSDDGEPKGTAGMPTLQTIKDAELSNIVVVTTRYFGGTLLGASGLVHAYKDSVKTALYQSEQILNKFCTKVEFSIDYTYLKKVQNEISNLGFIITDIIYKDNVVVQVLLEESQIENLKNAMMNLLNGNVELEVVGQEFASIGVE